ncbi:MAG: hypothetical protein KC656_02745, partial [Myxococcales bacterium]|nr:hypothetical protein [Myxococcales bacterium]
MRTNAYGDALLPRVPVLHEPREVHVVVRTVAELGWPEGAELDRVLERTTGFAPCPLETALLLRLAWTDPVHPRITVLSARAESDETALRGFYLRVDAEGPWLRAYVASYECV